MTGETREVKTLRPVLMNEWHWEKNGDLKPSHVKPSSHKKVWWVCRRGHEWQARINSRTSGNGCPYCSGKKVGSDNNLSVKRPDIAGEWHPDKNGDVTPADVTPGSHRYVWWICEHGHEWQAAVSWRTTGRGCPYCAGRKMGTDNSFAAKHPDIAGEWHPTRNGNLLPSEVTSTSQMIVWWICRNGHEWQARINDRRSCPYCSRRWASSEYNLAIKLPELAQEWHPKKNGDLSPFDVTPGSSKKVWWRCRYGHEWQARINQKGMCPYCSGRRIAYEDLKKCCLAIRRADLAKEWHPEKNLGMTASDVASNSRDKVWWLCERGHEWQDRIIGRRPCPFCSGDRHVRRTSLAVARPDVASEWHPEKNGNLTPEGVGPGSNIKVWWKCERGHEWQAVINNRTRRRACPCCSGKRVGKDNNLAVKRPDLAGEWHPHKNGYLTPSDVTPCTKRQVWWFCQRGHEWLARVSNRNRGTECPYCREKGRRHKQKPAQ